MIKKAAVNLLSVIILSNVAYAAHPLITDDTGTQGKGKMQFEFIGKYEKDEENSITGKAFEAPTIPVFSYGITDSLDIVFGLPFLSVRSEEWGSTSAVRGLGDASLELKARLYEADGVSLAVKPGISLPTGNENRGLGSGKLSYSTFFIATKEVEPWVFHFNAGYARNEYKLPLEAQANRKHLWHISLASQVQVRKDLELVANIGMYRNPDRTSNISPSFGLLGFIYSLSEKVDLDIGFKSGFNKAEPDSALLAGVTWRL